MTIAENWGATAGERALALACDELMPDAPVRVHRAVSVRAGKGHLFRWLCQLRIAPYSYDLIDNRGRRSPRMLTPGVEQLEVGQRFMSIFALVSFAPEEHITLRSRRCAVTYATLAAPQGTRLLVRLLFDPPAGRLRAPVIANALALGDLVMMRKQLLTLKQLAEDGRSTR